MIPYGIKGEEEFAKMQPLPEAWWWSTTPSALPTWKLLLELGTMVEIRDTILKFKNSVTAEAA